MCRLPNWKSPKRDIRLAPSADRPDTALLKDIKDDTPGYDALPDIADTALTNTDADDALVGRYVQVESSDADSQDVEIVWGMGMSTTVIARIRKHLSFISW
ncbi:uncharacterized protein YALI1_F15118g [Yarrowia lipolytica]|uniref:Uncharacterized protein n=1 Tax=Yarrowia lipolytica TaxID=4952 RepID=A0A1D8NN14_YARLL|nr:hypothetical protein YALI1_F15118g [Yarrowia lipolytica]